MLNRHFNFIVFLFVFSGLCLAQEKNNTLIKIDDDSIPTSEFLFMYNKQMELLRENDESSKKDYFDLFVNYKLKVKEAKDLQLDTFSDYRNELAKHRERLTQPYLKDQKVNDLLIDEAYDRTINEVEASHILIKLSNYPSSQDTLKAFERISEAREKVLQGEDFKAIAKEYSEDPSVKENGGNLGYFSAFKMTYPFECAAYNTSEGAVSMPFRTEFGYHIVQKNAIRKNKGERIVAHIMLSGATELVKKRIDSLYQVVSDNPVKFSILAKNFSDDPGSASDGGRLPKIKQDDTIEAFENVAFGLKEEGSIAAPVQTEFGWHIIKLVKSFPIPSKKEMYGQLRKKILADSRSERESSLLLDNLMQQYTITENPENISKALNSNLEIKDSEKDLVVLTINNRKYTLEEFVVFLMEDRGNGRIDALKKFKEASVLNYYKSHLEESNEEFRITLKEFSEGLLIFNLMQKEIWEKSKNEEGQQSFYESHRDAYEQPFEAIQGKVISDYQKDLETQWMTRLREKHIVEINSEELLRILNE